MLIWWMRLCGYQVISNNENWTHGHCQREIQQQLQQRQQQKRRPNTRLTCKKWSKRRTAKYNTMISSFHKRLIDYYLIMATLRTADRIQTPADQLIIYQLHFGYIICIALSMNITKILKGEPWTEYFRIF